MLRGRGLLARAACLGSLLTSVPPQLPELLDRRHCCTWSCVTVRGNDPYMSLLDREAKGLAFHSHRHALHSRVSVRIDIQEPFLPKLTSAPLIVSCPTLRRGLLALLCTKRVSACSITRPPGPNASYDTITFLPDGIERPFAFLKCTFEGPKSRPPYKVPWTGVLFTSAVRREELSIH